MPGPHKHKHPDNALGALLVVVFESILEVFLIAFVGFILARKGILSASVRKSLNRINVAVLTPSLLFSKVAFSLTPAKLSQLYIVPIGFVIVTAASLGIAYITGRLCRLKKSHLYFSMAVASAPNSNSLPIAFMQSLVVSLDQLKWGKDDTQDEMLGRALSYLVVFSTLGIVYRWSFAVKLLVAADEEIEPILPETQVERATSPEGLNGDAQPLVGASTSQLNSASPTGSPVSTKASLPANGSVFTSFPNTPHWRTPATSSRGSDDNENEAKDQFESQVTSDDDEWGVPEGLGRLPRTRPARSHFQTVLRRRWHRASKFGYKHIWTPLKKFLRAVQGFMTVPLYAALISILVCFIPPVQTFLDQLVPLRGALQQAGDCSIPLTLLVLGGFMHEEGPPTTAPKAASTAPDAGDRGRSINRKPMFSRGISLRKSTLPARKGENLTVAVGVASRMILTPLVLLPLLYFYSLGKDSVADDPVFIVTAALVIGSPPALTLAQITESVGGAFERLISKTMLISYGFLTAPSTVILVLLGLLIDKAESPGFGT